MKKKALLLGSLPAIAIAGGLFLTQSNDSEGKYEPRLSSHLVSENASIEGMSEYYHLLKGDFTKEDWERSRALAASINKDRSTFNWIDQGPDNIGGRTRAICPDRNSINHVYAGSVSGGLFESVNRGSTWHKVESFSDNLAISSICQTIDGTFYVATGHDQELSGGSQDAYDSGARGYGVYKSEADGSWTLIEGTQDYTWINEVVCDDVHNYALIGCNQGLIKYDAGTNTLSDLGDFPAAGSCPSVAVSKDGNLVIAHSVGAGPASVYVSNNAGSTFTLVSDLSETPGKIKMGSVGRIEFAISHEKVDGNYRVYGSASSNQLQGIWRSANNGMTWLRIAPAYDGTPGGFAPFTSGGTNGQGLYDNVITVVPGAPDRIILGGIDCYSWSTTGNWEQISQWFLSPTSSRYVHADNHEMVWDAWNRLYIGNDGGVGISDNATTETPDFYPANRGYNVTQFYATGVSAHGDVIGGAQDNGTKANYHTGTTWQEHKNVGGGDGFSADISFINRNIMFGSVYYSSVYRSSDRGENATVFYPPAFLPGAGGPCTVGAIDGTGCGQFFTNFELWEHPNDLASTDSLRYIATQNYSEGDVVMVPSATSQTFIEYTTPIDIVFDDTLYADPAYTYQDIIVVDEIAGTTHNLGVEPWEFISGAPTVSVGDSILLLLDPVNDTIIVESVIEVDHFVGTNPLKPGVFIDMGNEERITNVAWDTLVVQDPYQSWFALDMGGSNGLWMTRNALRFSAGTQGWFKAADGLGNIASMEFSKDGNYLFIGTWTGGLYRMTGFNEAYSPVEKIDGITTGGTTYDTLVDGKGNKFVTELRQIQSFSAPVTGISSGPIDNPEYLVVTLGNYTGTGKVRESMNATGAAPTFSPFSSFPGSGAGAATAGIPCYSVIVDRDDINIIVVGTEFGVFATEDGGSTWSNVSGGFGSAPVYDMQQNWRTWNEGCRRPGEIYIGTHGRGIWSTDAFLSLPSDNDNLSKDKFAPNVKLYPNPLKDNGTVEFNLATDEDVTLQVFNLNGQVVREVSMKNLQAGKNQIAFDANDLATGTYILRLSSSSMTETLKFIKH